MSRIPNQYTAIVNEQSIGDQLGISSDEIQQLVHQFYAKVREDKVLGPVFAEQMTEDWDHHLVKLCNFWTTVMFGKPVYKGNPLEVHGQITQISTEHFERWLDLFKQTLTEVCPNEAHITAFHQRASNMARVMTKALGPNLVSANSTNCGKQAAKEELCK